MPVCRAFARSKNAMAQLGRRRTRLRRRDGASHWKVDEDREVIQQRAGEPPSVPEESRSVANAAIGPAVAARTG
jgi:hypothetical protein